MFGDALTQSYGRLDGILVAIVLPNARGCRGDDNHLHLQISAAAAIYDIAVNIGEADPATNDVHSTEHDLALIGPPWSEGWHLDVAPADYTLLGVHAGDLPLHSQADNTQALVDQLAIANHVSIYATGFGPDGAHLVHRNAGGDGMVVTEPLSPVSHARLFSFTNQTF